MSGGGLALKEASPIGSAAVKRGMLVALTLLLALGGLGWRSWQLQVVHGAQFRDRAARQHESVVRQAATRGAILDADGKPLAITADGESIFADPRQVVDVTATAARLGELLRRDVRELEDLLSSPKQFVWLARFADGAQIDAVNAARLPGVGVKREPRRWYPASSTIGTLIGFAGLDGDGIDGLELSLNDFLRGQDASIEALRDARGKTMLANGTTAAMAGSTVRLSIDRTIQDIADAALRESIETNVAVAGTVVVLEVKTGRVLAIATAPNYDSNKPGDAEQTQARNRAVTDAFEIGSVMKLFTIAAALDAGITTPQERFFVQNGWKVGSKLFQDTHPNTVLTTSEIIKRSSNVGTIQIALRLGALRLYDALASYGFGAPTGIELPGERAGSLRHGKTWRDIELATMSFGYGLQVTPLQLAAAVAAIGNDGVYQAPRIVADVVDAFGRSIYAPEATPRRVMKATTAAAMREMMRSVYDGGELPGTAAKAPVPGFVCGGKTGTARKLDAKTKGYGVKRYYASFAGLAPIEAPTLAIVVLIDDPTGKNVYGGSVAAPVFARIASEALTYLGVAGMPSPAASVGEVVAANAAAAARADGPQAPVVAGVAVAEEGIELDDVLGLAVEPGLGVADVTGASGVDGAELYREAPPQAPSFVGKSLPDALALAAARHIELVVNGSGVVVRQQARWRDGRVVVHVELADGRGIRTP